MKSKYQEVLRLAASSEMNGGREDIETIAAQVGLSETSIRSILSGHNARERINAMLAPIEEEAFETFQQAQAASVIAQATQLDLMTNPAAPAAVRASIAKDLRDRGGIIRKEMNVSATLSEDRILELRKRIVNNNNNEQDN